MKHKTKMKIYFYIEKYAPALLCILMCVFCYDFFTNNIPITISVVINIVTSIAILLYLKGKKQIPIFEVKEFNDRLKRYTDYIINNCVVLIFVSIFIDLLRILLPNPILNIIYLISVFLYLLAVGNFIRHLIILYTVSSKQ